MQNLNITETVKHFIEFTNHSIFLTGRAGTGKTTLLKSITENTHKRYVILAPTGVAAINAEGSTIHSFFSLHPFTFIPFGDVNATGDKKIETTYSLSRNIKLNSPKIEVIKNLDVLIIDEISMVRCDLLDAIDVVMRKYRNNQLPFGGVQLFMIGDLYQLPPVVKEDEAQILKPHYPSFYFFESSALKRSGFLPIELDFVYRQSDEKFLEVLNDLRYGSLKPETEHILNERLIPHFSPNDEEGYITLTTHVKKAETINLIKLNALEGKELVFKAEISGDFNPNSYPAEELLKVKINAQVMFIKNNKDHGYYNGKIGWIDAYDEESNQFLVRCGENELIWVGKEIWENIQYSFNAEKNEIGSNKKGDFSQFPLRLAWAITIHKSQGLTFDKAIIDAGSAFATGQVYVALSRCRTLEGMVLKSMFSENELPLDRQIDLFHISFLSLDEIHKQLMLSRLEYIQFILINTLQFNWLKPLIRETQDALIPSIKLLSSNLAEDLRNWENWNVEIQKTANQYQPKILELIAILKRNELPTEGILRFGKAVNYFTNEVIQHFAKVLVNISKELINEKNSKVLMRELKLTELQLRRFFRQIIVADEILKSHLNFPETIYIKKQILNKLENVYQEITQNYGYEPKKIAVVNNRNKGKKNSQKGKVKGETFSVTLEMYRSGKSIETIAMERELKSGTIISHLAKWVLKGELNVLELMDEKIFNEINDTIEGLENELTWGQILSKLNEKYEYKYLSFVNAYRRNKAEASINV
jgi:hypothetical protein